MNDEQIANWRAVLAFTLGPYAFIMPKEDIESLRDRIQRRVNSVYPPTDVLKTIKVVKTICDCDTTKCGTTIHKDGSVTCNKCNLPRTNKE
jgi:hypothetical protein